MAHPPRHHAIDLLKGLAIIAVVLIHFMGGLKVAVDMDRWYTAGWIGLNQILRFSVPVFVFLSGYSLAHKYRHLEFNLKEYFLNRVLKLIPLYLLWVTIILLTVYLVPDWRGFADDYSTFEQVFLGRAEYHLYFVPMIFQLYVFFPVFLWAIRRRRNLTLIVAGVIQALVFTLISTDKTTNLTAMFVSDQQQYIWFASWIIYFIWGMYLKEKEATKDQFASWFYPAAVGLTVVGLSWSIVDAILKFNSGVDIIVAGRFTRWPIVAFNLGLTTAVIGYKHRLENLAATSFSWLITVGKHSFLIYLLHTLVIRLIMGIWRQQLTFGHSLFVVLMLILGIFVSRKLLQA